MSIRSLLRRWPAIMSRRQYQGFRVAYGLFCVFWSIGLISLFFRWNDLRWGYRALALAFLTVTGPSIPDFFQSYDSYRKEHEQMFPKGDASVGPEK